ncbi:MAG: hypothetical protein GC171_03215 [Terrimonas sp.]|nr:hypothetical protein [Terrimonas sp.]
MIKLFIFFVLMCFSGACHKKGNGTGKNISYLISPFQTDPDYATTDESHYIVRNNKTHLNKLLLFIGGSYSIPKNYALFCDHGATLGLDVISLSYPNKVATAPLGSSADPQVFDHYRNELCFGNQVSDVVSVDLLNCITTRTIKLLIYLNVTYPDQDWRQYLSPSNTLIWDKIIVAGHSQGSGHACYLGKKNRVDRVIMLSGPNDYSTYYSSPANWLSETGLTPLNRQFSLLHTQDEIVSFDNQVANLRSLGLLTATQSPTPADNLSTPYFNAHALSLHIPAISYHSSTVGANPILPAIWTYLLTTP